MHRFSIISYELSSLSLKELISFLHKTRKLLSYICEIWQKSCKMDEYIYFCKAARGGSTLKNTGITLMFIGAVMLAIFLYVDMQISFGLWLTGFLISMLVAGTGAITMIVYLAKGIKADKLRKNDSK